MSVLVLPSHLTVNKWLTFSTLSMQLNWKYSFTLPILKSIVCLKMQWRCTRATHNKDDWFCFVLLARQICETESYLFGRWAGEESISCDKVHNHIWSSSSPSPNTNHRSLLAIRQMAKLKLMKWSHNFSVDCMTHKILLVGIGKQRVVFFFFS